MPVLPVARKYPSAFRPRERRSAVVASLAARRRRRLGRDRRTLRSAAHDRAVARGGTQSCRRDCLRARSSGGSRRARRIARSDLDGYHLYHVARADALRRLGRRTGRTSGLRACARTCAAPQRTSLLATNDQRTRTRVKQLILFGEDSLADVHEDSAQDQKKPSTNTAASRMMLFCETPSVSCACAISGNSVGGSGGSGLHRPHVHRCRDPAACLKCRSSGMLRRLSDRGANRSA